MISQEMLSLGNNSSVIREIFEYSKKRKSEIGSSRVFDFSLGNPSIPSPPEVEETINKLLHQVNPIDLHSYTSAAGDMNVRNKIAENIASRFNFNADSNLIYMTCGAAASLTISLKAVTCPDDEVIILAPYFPEYEVFVKNAGAKPIIVSCNKDSFTLSVSNIEKAITKKTKAIIINSPNNPSGVVLSNEEIIALAELLKRKSKEFGTDIIIISDDPYRELVYDDIKVPFIPCCYDNTIVCYSYSKALSIPGERIGYILVSPNMKNSKDVFSAVCGAGRSMGYVCAPSLLQFVVSECDNIKPDISAYEKNRKALCDGLSSIGYTYASPNGAFYLFMKALEPDANAFCERAKKHELLLVPSDSFGVTGYVRIAYCVEYSQIINALPAFKALYDEYKGENI